MRDHLSIKAIFPISDEPSARLMTLKAECLQLAGVISEPEKQAVHRKAAKFLMALDRMPAVSRTEVVA